MVLHSNVKCKKIIIKLITTYTFSTHYYRLFNKNIKINTQDPVNRLLRKTIYSLWQDRSLMPLSVWCDGRCRITDQFTQADCLIISVKFLLKTYYET